DYYCQSADGIFNVFF
nr:immunoglobulin light chain junction region [Macaca mulatta]MOW27504.1 immunoglobulin light chain junction region [Macaca mulatta]MOW27626.1 immunoglobulin light chain junction region [Macaca mulatta]MOW28328.1 immunoglobulin light chain junction region [Macaca mulatta]MOW28799.1 immunoglobulin light chain junction region [Macaca mulatta]